MTVLRRCASFARHLPMCQSPNFFNNAILSTLTLHPSNQGSLALLRSSANLRAGDGFLGIETDSRDDAEMARTSGRAAKTAPKSLFSLSVYCLWLWRGVSLLSLGKLEGWREAGKDAGGRGLVDGGVSDTHQVADAGGVNVKTKRCKEERNTARQPSCLRGSPVLSLPTGLQSVPPHHPTTGL
ncbi:hypothetical protein LY78DRAFT_662723 [Colletotrichum sublineola]|nr:hypothetical protein LY78DRAFT_662723 [Colletotrichum sublineola]